MMQPHQCTTSILLLQEPASNAEHTRRADTVRLALGLPLCLRSALEHRSFPRIACEQRSQARTSIEDGQSTHHRHLGAAGVRRRRA